MYAAVLGLAVAASTGRGYRVQRPDEHNTPQTVAGVTLLQPSRRLEIPSPTKTLASLFFAFSPRTAVDPSNLRAHSTRNGAGLASQFSREAAIGSRGIRADTPAMQFGGFKNPFADKSDGATTLTLTVGFRVVDRGPSSILKQLDEIGFGADTTTAEGIADLCGKAALLLMRRSEQWISCSGSAEHKGDDDEALAEYDRLAVKEAAKFEDRSPDERAKMALEHAGLQKKKDAADADSTFGVVTLVACLMGNREDKIKPIFQGTARDMSTALEELATAARGEDEVFAFEIFWVPGADEEVLTQEEMIVNWPELMSI